MIPEKAAELGRFVGQSDEYQALKRANDRLMEEKELRQSLERLREIQLKVADSIERGVEPPEDQRKEADRLVSIVQGHPAYQGLVAAQANFDKLMMKINEWILEGMRRGSESRIITLG